MVGVESDRHQTRKGRAQLVLTAEPSPRAEKQRVVDAVGNMSIYRLVINPVLG